MTWCVQFIKGALIMKNIQQDNAMFNWMIMAAFIGLMILESFVEQPISQIYIPTDFLTDLL
jgi:hypothetical protein